jgi:regulation of enolase protein 1 (concanavalin A-like superfamily)
VITNGGTGKAPVWLKIRRRGKVLTASRSADGVTWQDIGTEIIAMAGDVEVGLAVTSHKASAATTAQFSQVSVAPPDLPTSGLLSWSGTDVGLPSVGGSQQVQDDDIIVSGAGSIGGTFDQFHYMYRQVSADADIVARIKAVQYIAAGSRGGVMVRDSLGGNGTHVSMLLRAGNGTILQSRSVPGGSTTTSAVGTLEPYWVKLEVRGQVVTAFQSPDGVSWSTVGGATLSLPSPYYIGVVVASQDAQTLANAAFDQLRLVEVGQNQPPTIALTGPDTSVSYTAPADVTISADASDPDGTISSVDFYQNGTLLGSVSAPPYAYSWPSVPSGTYTFSAVAHDNGGATSTSDTRTITVNGASNAPPAVTLTAPATGSRFVAPATINVSATASDSDGSIARVQFYSGATLLATVTAAPYTFAWTNVQAGTYTLTAVAQDDKGASSTSAAATITVSAPNQAPTVSLTAPASESR